MADRIDIGMGPRLGFDPTDTGGFKYVGQKKLTQEEYGSRKVNFYNEYLGLPGLGGESGIEVGAPEVGEDITPGRTDEGADESEAVTNVLRDPTFTDGEATTGASSIKYGADAYKDYTSEYATYSEYLRGAGKMDRVNLVSGIYEPLTKGNYRDIDLSVLGVEAREGVQAVKDAPQTISEEFAELRKEGFAGVKKKVAEGVPKAMAGVFAMSGLGPIGSLLTGDEVKNAFGETSFRPSGPLGVISDLVHAKQYEDMTQIRAAESAAAMEASIAGGAFVRGDTGFAMQFGSGMGITRRPGARGYTGNLQGMSVNQIKDLEALTKGYRPETYRFDMSKEGTFGGRASVGVVEDGGIFSDNNNRLKGFYTAEGRYYTPGVGYSRYGNRADLQRLATTNGLTYDKAKDLLDLARAGKGKFGDLVQAEKTRIANERAEQRRQEEQRRAEEAQRQRNIESGQQRLAGDFYSDSSDEGGPSLSTGSAESAFDNVSDFEGLDPDDYAAGGVVGMAAGGAMAAGMGSGFVDRPPSQVPEEQTVADNVETQLPEGAFVINAAAVEFAGEQDIKKMLNDAQKEAVRRGITIDNSENSTKLIDVAISRGEVTVAPYLAKIIGYDRLNKINNRGKPETKERLQEAAQGGFLGLAEGGAAEDPFDYEDPIILNEVNKGMQALLDEYAKRGVKIDTEPFDTSFSDAEVRESQERARQINGEYISGTYASEPLPEGGGRPYVSVPRTPSLFNFFIMAEELHHLDAFKDSNQVISPYDTRPMATVEMSYAEELRAKQKAYETVKGLLPKGKRTKEFTEDNYAKTFLFFLKQATPEDRYQKILAHMIKKYPELERVSKQDKKASGGFISMAEGGVPTPTRKPKREQLADIELRADLETFIQGDALARLGYKLYEDGHVRFNTAVDTEDYGVETAFKAAYFPPGNVRTDKRGVIPIRDIANMRTGRVLEEQGIASSQLKSDAGRVILAGNMFDAPKKKGSDTLYDASETTVDMISIAHEFRHAALDYLSKTYDLGLPTLKQEERIMDYADNQAIERAGKVNPKLKERYFNNPDYKLMSERGKSAGDSSYLRKQYEQYTGLAEEILKAMNVPPQSPAIEKEGFLTRTYKSLVN